MQTKLFGRDFTLVVVGQIISLFGNAILRFALPLYLLRETGSSTLFGVVTACSFAPMVILSMVGGVLADRVNKRDINATVTATANIGLNTNDLKTLIEAVRTSASELNAEDKETVSDSLEVIEAEATAEKPKKGMLKTAIAALNNVKDTVKGVAEFGTAVTALIQLVAPLLQ